jgi:hypothetical protein
MALMVKTVNILAENPRDSSSIQNLFLPGKKSIPDVILIPHSLSPPNSRVEGGDFRDSLRDFQKLNYPPHGVCKVPQKSKIQNLY